MYYCEKCKRFVEGSTWESQTPNHKFTRTEEPSNNPFYREVRCEMCGSDNMTEANECECCGEPTLETYCEWCMDEATSVVNLFISRFNMKTPLDRIKLLSEACEKVWDEEKEKENGI